MASAVEVEKTALFCSSLNSLCWVVQSSDLHFATGICLPMRHIRNHF